ncbi:MAG: phosphoribosylanthranilate isomerase [Candidatus Omnitrophica bacterium]|nr:phosphoribosylanthranilate isomerase [Candidatus Omnitrophota bacterium]
MVKVKVCGITNLEDARAAIEAGADALGFVFYRKSPRYISAVSARIIIRKLPARIEKVGVFVDAPEKRIKKIVSSCGLSMVQFHGHESAQFCRRFPSYKIIKAFGVKDSVDWTGICRYKTYAYLFDTYAARKKGGTGRSFKWKLLKNRLQSKVLIFLSGGLTANNVSSAIGLVRPDWVDASTSLELSPGKKDPRKINAFIKAAQR